MKRQVSWLVLFSFPPQKYSGQWIVDLKIELTVAGTAPGFHRIPFSPRIYSGHRFECKDKALIGLTNL